MKTDYSRRIHFVKKTTTLQQKEVLVLLTNQWADWEAAYAIANIQPIKEYVDKTIAVDHESKTSLGGLRTEIDYTLEEYCDLDALALLILPGGLGWEKEPTDEIAAFVKKVIDSKIPVAAICGATLFLGRYGFLNQVKHTGDELELFQKEPHYQGEAFYEASQIVMDQNIITANETAAVEFADAIFRVLNMYTDEQIDGWYRYFKQGMVQ